MLLLLHLLLCVEIDLKRLFESRAQVLLTHAISTMGVLASNHSLLRTACEQTRVKGTNCVISADQKNRFLLNIQSIQTAFHTTIAIQKIYTDLCGINVSVSVSFLCILLFFSLLLSSVRLSKKKKKKKSDTLFPLRFFFLFISEKKIKHFFLSFSAILSQSKIVNSNMCDHRSLSHSHALKKSNKMDRFCLLLWP